MDALIIGPASELAGAVARGLRRQGRSVLEALPADASDGERTEWLLDDAGRPVGADTAGVALAAIAAWRGASVIAVVAIAAVTTALLRAVA